MPAAPTTERGAFTLVELLIVIAIIAILAALLVVGVNRVWTTAQATAHRTTIYASTSDKAIGLADVIFASRRRVGALGPRDFSPEICMADTFALSECET